MVGLLKSDFVPLLFFQHILRYRVAGSLSACGLLLSSFLIYTQVCNLAIVPLNVLHTLMFEFLT